MNVEKFRNLLKSFCLGYWFLFFLSIIYKFGFKIKNLFYNLGILKSKKFLKPIVCVGNISSGGTGKTTFVISLAKELYKAKVNALITTRGYKSEYSKSDIIDPLINSDFLNDRKMSDEQKLIAISLKDYNIPVIASKNRVKSIEYSISKYNPDLIIMDDGFQNFSINKDISIVIININMLFDKILPLGNLRENYSGLKRADFVILNHCELFDLDYIQRAYSYVQRYIEEEKIIKASYEISGFVNNITGEKITVDNFRKIFKDVAVFSGIGDNTQFRKMIEKNGFNVSKIWQFPDHHKYTYLELKSINELRANLPLLTTYKDSVKFISESKEIFLRDIYCVDVDIRLSNSLIIKKILSLLK